MLKVFGRRNSSSVQLVMWTIEELGITHERLEYGHGHHATNTDEYLAMNPMGRVPVVIDGPVCMFESAAILRYLGATYGTDTFWPKSPATRAKLDVWAEWGKNTFTEAVLEIFVYDVRLPPDTRDPAILEAATQALNPLATILDAQLQQGPWLGGDVFSFADIACGHILHRYFSLEWDRPSLPNLRRYYDSLQTRAAYRNNAMVSYEDIRGSY